MKHFKRLCKAFRYDPEWQNISSKVSLYLDGWPNPPSLPSGALKLWNRRQKRWEVGMWFGWEASNINNGRDGQFVYNSDIDAYNLSISERNEINCVANYGVANAKQGARI